MPLSQQEQGMAVLGGSYVRCQENVIKSLQLDVCAALFAALTRCGVQDIWAASLVLSASLLLPGCTDFCKLMYLN